MKKYEIIRKLFDYVMNSGESYDRPDAISAHCTRDGLSNRVHIKKVNLSIGVGDYKIESMAVMCTREDFSDATDADLRIEFESSNPYRTILYANEVDEEVLSEIAKVI